MKFDYLREFIAVSQCTQMYEAADSLGVSLSTLSKHIKALEIELGVPLFLRSRKVVLTQYGRTMLTYARELVALQDQYQLEFRSATPKGEELVIGTSQFPYKGDVSDMIERYQRSEPAQPIVIKEFSNGELPDAVLNGTCDVAFYKSLPSLARRSELLYFPYSVNRFTACLPAGHPCAKQSSVTFQDLAHEPVFLRTLNSTVAEVVKAGYEANGIEPEISTCGFYATFDNVRSGKGITFYMNPPKGVDFSDMLVMIPVDPPVYTHMDILVRPDCMSPAVQGLLQFIWHEFASDRTRQTVPGESAPQSPVQV